MIIGRRENVSYFEFGGRVSDAALLAGNMSCRRRESFATTYVRLRWENERRFGKYLTVMMRKKSGLATGTVAIETVFMTEIRRQAFG